MSEVPIILMPGGPRPVLLIRRAFQEAGLPCPAIDERAAPTALLYPQSFVDAVNAMSGARTHDYCFMGSLYRSDTFEHRRWILGFAERRFTDRSYLLISDGEGEHTRLGPFDHTGDTQGVFVPRHLPPEARDHFNDAYFRVLRSSQFTLCPAGDLPWSMRFFEAIMCRSIPIVSDRQHVGRNDLERSIGYHVYLPDDQHRYDEALVEENYRMFLRHQTLIDPESDGLHQP